MNKEERYDEKDLLQELSTDKARRSNILISLNCSLQRTERIVANIKDMRELQEYKIAVVSVESELKELQQENKKLKEQLEASEKARKEASNILKDYIPDEYIRSCDTSDGIGRYELDTESWQYKIYEILDIDKGE